MPYSDLVPSIRNALSLSATHDNTTILPGIERQALRLLRDYNFPFTVKVEVLDTVAGARDYTLPEHLKKPLLVRFRDGTSLANYTYTDRLRRSPGPVLPQSSGEALYYWIADKLYTDVLTPAGAPNLKLEFHYQHLDIELAEAKLLASVKDVLFTLTCFRLSVELGKQELAKVFAATWVEDQKSIAKFTAELEYGDTVAISSRESTVKHLPRYG